MTDSNVPMPLFRLGFRPLFLFGALSAVLLIAWWTFYWGALTRGAPIDWQPVGGAIWWHAHEMVFGFTTAIIGGFLLTAVRNWTGVPTITGKRLAFLVLAWLAGRLCLAFDVGLSGGVILLIDQLYLLGLAAAVAHPIIKAKMWRNLMFVPILLMFAVLNGLSHLIHLLDVSVPLAMNAIHSAIILVCLVIAIIGGRVLPFFTANGLGIAKVESIPWLDLISLVSIVLLVAFALMGFHQIHPMLLGVIALISGIANLWRWSRWKFWLCFKVPLLWSVHLSYLFIPLGILGLAAFAFGWIDNLSSVLHVFTVGAIGGVILSMITRVSLGHTGRPLKASKLLSAAFIFIILAVFLRSVLGIFAPELLGMGIMKAGAFWVLAYLIFLGVHAPHLMTARPDGKPI